MALHPRNKYAFGNFGGRHAKYEMPDEFRLLQGLSCSYLPQTNLINMKRIILIVAVFLICATSFAQILKPVKWSYASKRINDNEAIVFIKATMEKGWHIIHKRFLMAVQRLRVFHSAPQTTIN